jgi:3-oxoacyl-[acyl-carrier protein] reductase
MNLADARVVISGASGGLGREFTLQLLRAGARVCAGDLNAAGLRSLRAEVAGLPGHLVLESLDVTDEASVESFTKRAGEALGSINTLINCAGILRDGFLVSPSEEGGVRKMTTAQWQRVLDVNLTGAFYLTREVGARMVAGGWTGVVVNISSFCHAGNAGQGNYAASKAALNAAGRSWALELGPHGIRVGTVAPGVITTPFLDGISEEAQGRLRGAIPLGHLGSIYDVWLAVKFIIECEFFTGRVIEVDGGASVDASA